MTLNHVYNCKVFTENLFIVLFAIYSSKASTTVMIPVRISCPN